MDELELHQLKKNPQWVAVIERYHQQSAFLKSQTADFDGWVPRLHEVADVPSEQLPGIHGKLIAFGFLKFDLAGRDAGVRYQLTPIAKQSLNASSTSDEAEQSDDAAQAA